MAFATLAQLKSRVWSTREDLVKELKANALKPETEAYRPAETGSGRWFIEEIDPDASQEVPDQPLNTGQRKSASSRIKAAGISSDAKVREAISLANSFKVLMKLGGKDKPIEEAVGTLQEARMKAAELNFQNKGKKAAIFAVAPDGKSSVAVPDDYMAGNALFNDPAPKAAAKKAEPAKKAAAAKPMPKGAAKKAAAPKAKAKKTGKSSDPSSDELPKGFDDWLVAQASRKEGVMRTEINKKLGTERRWKPHLDELAKARGLKSTMKREGRFTLFFLTKA